jgi:DNA-binding MarR family transcriptional regulator
MTPGQLAVLTALQTGPRTIHDVKLRLGYPATYDSAHLMLRRLDDRGMVRRTPSRQAQGQLWELTQDGRDTIEAAT